MTVIDGYSITQYVTQNQIVITLPQMLDTLTNTIDTIANRRKELTDLEEAALLIAVKAMFENKNSTIETEKIKKEIEK